MERVKKFLDDGILELAGQGINPGQLFIAGRCSTVINSTAAHAAVEAGAKFNWSATFLPTEKDSPAKNSTIGGAALWTLKGHKDEVYKGVAAFYNFLGNVETQVWWHKATGYVPVTQAAYEAAKSQGYYKDKPDARDRGRPAQRAARRATTRSGFRLGNSAQANIAIKEEIQAGLLGQKPMQKAMDDAVGARKRGAAPVREGECRQVLRRRRWTAARAAAVPQAAARALPASGADAGTSGG